MIEPEKEKIAVTQEYDESISELPLFHTPEIPSLPRPFVKWVGGKRNLLHEIRARFPKQFNNYFEPFVGGGAVFFDAHQQLKHATLVDKNLELIITYTVINHFPEQLIEKLQIHASQHSKEYYYKIRSQPHSEDSVEVAARFLYLNKTCYNGLSRVNKSGKFNTPMGSYKNPTIVQEENLRACHYALQKATLRCGDFTEIKSEAGDFVYFDPPYHPTNEISFTEYTVKNFTEHDQIRLRDFAVSLHKAGVYVMLSNSKTQFIEKVYNSKFFRVTTVQAPRAVNCKPNQRGAVDEVLITNF